MSHGYIRLKREYQREHRDNWSSIRGGRLDRSRACATVARAVLRWLCDSEVSGGWARAFAQAYRSARAQGEFLLCAGAADVPG